MSWSDRKALETIITLRDDFAVETFIETGTFRGVNAKVQSFNFSTVLTVENNLVHFVEAEQLLWRLDNVFMVHSDSANFLRRIRKMIEHSVHPVMIYLDAHFFDPLSPIEMNWVVLRELHSLKGLSNCIVVIHDFAAQGLGHLVYDGQPLDFEFLRSALLDVNPNFSYYTNTREGCDILSWERVQKQEILGLDATDAVKDNLEYAWKSEEKAYRGLLYCTPRPLDLSKYTIVPMQP